MHALRHTLAVILHDRGIPPRYGAALLGHSLPVHLSVHVPRPEDAATLAADALALALAAEG
jgi:integrase